MKLLGSTKSNIQKVENVESFPHLRFTEVVTFHCNIVNNNNQQNSRDLYTFIPTKSFGQLLDILPKHFIFLKHLIQDFYRSKRGLLIKVLYQRLYNKWWITRKIIPAVTLNLKL